MNAPSLSAAVADMFRWVLEVTGGTAAPVIEELQASGWLDHDAKRETFAVLAGGDAEESAELIGNCLAALHIGFEVLGRDPRQRLHVRWFGQLSEDAERLAILLACGCGARLTTFVRYARPALDAQLYYGGSGEVFGVVADGAPVCPVTDPERALGKLVRGKQLIEANNATGRDTLVRISLAENRNDLAADVIAPFYGDAD